MLRHAQHDGKEKAAVKVVAFFDLIRPTPLQCY